MTPATGNRFEDFFADDAYVVLKNLLYNYVLRKRAIRKSLYRQEKVLILEVGSGLSPMVTDSGAVVYSDLSFSALRILKKIRTSSFFVVADAMRLPFHAGVFSQVICSEVLEHLPDDRKALREMASVMRTEGSLILTFPHRHGYFTRDDQFVNHLRRYELYEMEERLREVAMTPVEVVKILGPLEKITMVAVTSIIIFLRRFRGMQRMVKKAGGLWPWVLPFFKWFNRLLCLPMWVDAAITPRYLSAVILVRAVKSENPKPSAIDVQKTTIARRVSDSGESIRMRPD